MENKPLVSVALAAFNGGRFLKQQLTSLVNQTYPFIEIIISDDGSTDDTKAIIAEFKLSHSNIFFFENPGNNGIKNNFTNALKHCKGAYIALCDQDDIWMPNKIELLVNEIGDSALIYHNSLFINEQEGSLKTTIADNFNCYTGNDPSVFLLHNCVSGHACMFDQKLLSTALPFPEARFHDWWLAFVAAANGGVKYFPQVLVKYRQHPKAATDILKRKTNTAYEREITKYKIESEWYQRSVDIAGKDHPLVKEWASLYRKRENEWFSPAIFLFVLRNKKTLFAVRKTNNISVFFAALKLFWGLRLKRSLR